MLTKRVFWLILLLLGGAGSFVYGSLFHSITIYEEKDREVTIAVPVLPGMEEAAAGLPSQTPSPNETENPSPLPAGGAVHEKDPFQAASSGVDHEKDPFHSSLSPADSSELDKNPAETPNEPPPGLEMTSKKVTEKVLEAVVDPEGAIVRDATIGGVTRLADGRLKRTYSGLPPSLCPT